ncbi:extensin family protein [Mesorhizobium sp. SP-1A]|uniref:extensin-like domain-containing protein n=1 Tax=Mesorhizobium sp. SP-1A TaxID=3077840 RepID=UPI0028F6FF5E|nr:extensin family protein [Mesorhizobium sp. SP-1A]
MAKIFCAAATLAARTLRHMRFASPMLAAAAVAAVSACTTGDVFNLTPAVDVGTQTAAVAPYPELRRQLPPAPMNQPAAPVEQSYPDPASPDAPQDPGAEAASAPEMSQPAISDPAISEPAVSGPAMAEPAAPAPAAPAPVMTVAYPRIDRPALPSDQFPADEVDCRRELKRLRVTYTDIPPIQGRGQCGIAHPVRVTAIGSIQMRPAATLTCNMAATFASWTKNELVPAARWRYWSGVRAIRAGSYSCRNIAGERTLSEHGKGNAIDVMSIDLTNGDNIDVRKPGLFAFRTRGFLNTVRADGCQYFTTVLGPGYNYDHRNHFHFDIKNRRNGYRACR